jgi:alpha-mannosidase II
MLHSWTPWEKSTGFETRLEKARRALSIFQHHDGVTGTAKDYVMKDYEEMMKEGIKNSKFVIQQAVYRLLTEANIYHPDYSFTYFNIDDSRSATNDDSARSVIIIGDEIPYKYVVIHNSQTYSRNEIVEFYVARPFVCVTDSDGNSVDAQISPVWSWHHNLYQSVQPQASTTKYRLLFTASVSPLGLAVYKLIAKNTKGECSSTTYAQTTILTDTPFDVTLSDFPEKVKFSEPREVSLRINDNSPGASFNKFGLLKSLSQDGKSPVVPVHLEYMKYGTRATHGQKSGAYLFLPDGPAQKMSIGYPVVVVTNGVLESSVTSGLPFVIVESILRAGGDALEIRNLVDIGEMSNTEIVMRLNTNIKSKIVNFFLCKIIKFFGLFVQVETLSTQISTECIS